MPPVVAGIVAVAGAVGAAASAVGFAATGGLMAVGFSATAAMATVSVLGQLALGVGLTALQRAIGVGQQSQGARAGVRVQGSTTEDASETIILGKYPVPGDLLYENSRQNYEMLVQVYELSGWPSTVNRVFINGEWCDFAGDDGRGWGRPVLQYRRDGRDYLWIKLLNNPTVADGYLRDEFGDDAEIPWTADMIGVGLPIAIVTSRYKPSVHRKPPEILWEMAGTPIYDPRKDSTRGGSGTQRLNNRSTWQVSNNPMVQAWNVLYGLRDPITQEFEWGFGVSPDDLPNASWFAAMNECDVLVSPGFTRRQYECGIEIPIATMSPSDALEEIFNSCQGQIAEVAGQFIVKAGPPTATVYSFTDDDLIANAPTEFNPFPGIDEIPSGVSATYFEPADGWTPKVAPLRGALGRVTKIQLPTVFSGAQAQFLAASAFETSKRFRRHTFVLPPEARRLSPLDVITWTSTENFYSFKEFQVTMTKDLPDGTVAVAVLEVDPDDYNAPALAPTEVGFVSRPTEVVGGVLNFAANPITITGANGQTRAAIQLLWNKNIEFVDWVRWQVRLKSDPSVYPGQGSLENPNAASNDTTRVLVKNGAPLVKNSDPLIVGRIEDVSLGVAIVSDGILGATEYECRMRYEPTSGIWDWSEWITVLTDDVRIGPNDLQPGLLQAITDAEAAVQAAIDEAVGNFDLVDQKVTDLETQIQAARDYTDSSITTVVTTVNGKNSIFYGPTAPVATAINDEWVRSTDKRRFRATTLGTGGWVDASDSRIALNTANIMAETIVRQAETQSLAAQISSVSATLNGTSASVTATAAALVQLENIATAGLTVRFKAGGANGEIEFVASDDPINGPAVNAKFNGNLLIDGSLSSRSLIVTDASGNLVADSALQDPDYWQVSGPNSSWDVIINTSRGSDAPSKGELRFTPPYAWIYGQPFIVSPGETFTSSGYYSSLSSARFYGYQSVRWYDKTGDYLGQSSKTFDRSATSPLYYEFEVTAPPSAATARYAVVPNNPNSAHGRWWKPSVRRKGEAGSLITPGSITSELLIGTKAVLTKEVQAGVATIGSAAIRNLSVTNAKIANASITTAKIGDLQVDRLKIKNNAVGTWSFAQSIRGAKSGSNNIRILMEAPGDYTARCEMITIANDSESNDYSDFTWRTTEGLANGSTSQRRVQVFGRSVLTGYTSLVLTGATPNFTTLYPSYINFRLDFDHNINGPVTTQVELSVLRRYK